MLFRLLLQKKGAQEGGLNCAFKIVVIKMPNKVISKLWYVGKSNENRYKGFVKKV